MSGRRQSAKPPAPAQGSGDTPSIFELLSEYHRSLESMQSWLSSAELTESERMGIADAWQHEMAEWFRSHGYCFGCNRSLDRCECD